MNHEKRSITRTESQGKGRGITIKVGSNRLDGDSRGQHQVCVLATKIPFITKCFLSVSLCRLPPLHSIPPVFKTFLRIHFYRHFLKKL